MATIQRHAFIARKMSLLLVKAELAHLGAKGGFQ
jgi:hypothetical protein